MNNQLKNCLPCDGIQVITPQTIYNRPGLDALKYRIGTQATFFESLLARISTLTADELAELSLTVNQRIQRRRNQRQTSPAKTEHPLRDWLTTREKTDPAIAMLDAWSVVADVLTFYQERIANEGYLRTAQERRSIAELARLTGYRLRPGVSSTVYLAFEVEDTSSTNPFGNTAPVSQPSGPILIPRGTAAKSTPTPGTHEEPQTFETSRDLLATTEWNELLPRQTRPNDLRISKLLDLERVYLKGIGLRLQQSDLLAIDIDPVRDPELRGIIQVTEEPEKQRTVVQLSPDALSPRLLVADVAAALNAFIADQAATQGVGSSPAMSPIFREEVRDVLASTVSRCVGQDLAVVDEEFHTLAETLMNQTTGVRQQASQLNSWATALHEALSSDLVSPTVRHGLFDPRQLVAGYRTAIAEIAGRYGAHLLAIDELSRNLPGVSAPVPDRIAHIKHVLCDYRLLQCDQNDSKLPAIVLGSEASGAAVPVPTLGSTVGLPVALLWKGQDQNATATFRIVASTDSLITAPPAVSKPLSALASDLRNTTVDVPDNKLCVVLLNVTDGSNRLLGATIRLIRRGTATTGEFAGMELEKTGVYRIGSPQIPESVDPDFFMPQASTAAVNKLYWARIEVLDGGVLSLASTPAVNHRYKIEQVPTTTTMWDLVPIDGTNRSLSEFQSALRDVAIDQSGRLRTSVLFSFYTQDLPNPTTGVTTGSPAAAALRDIVYYRETRDRQSQPLSDPYPTVLNRLAALHGALCVDGATLQQNDITDFFNDLDVGAIAATVGRLNDITSETASKLELSDSIQASLQARSPLPQNGTSIPVKHNIECLRELAKSDRAVKDLLSNIVAAELSPGSGSAKLATRMQSFESVSAADSDLLRKWRTDVLSGRVSAAFVRVAAETTPTAATVVEALRDSLERDSADLKRRFVELNSTFGDLSQRIVTELNERRLEFSRRLETIHAASVTSIEPNVAVTPALNTVIAAVKALTTTLKSKSCLILGHSGAPCADDASAPSPTLMSLLETLTANTSKLALRRILDGWRELAIRVRTAPKQPPLPSADPSTSSGVLTELQRLMANVQSGDSTIFANLAAILADNPDLITQLAASLDIAARDFLFDLVRRLRGGRNQPAPKVWVFRSRVRLFGWNAPDNSLPTLTPQQLLGVASTTVSCLLNDSDARNRVEGNFRSFLASHTPPTLKLNSNSDDDEAGSRLFLDSAHPQTAENSVVAVALLGQSPHVFRVEQVTTRPRTAYNLSSECTIVTLPGGSTWWTPGSDGFKTLRSTSVFCDAESMPLADAPEESVIADPSLSGPASTITLDGPVFGLSTGRPIIVEGQSMFGAEKTRVRNRELCEITDIDHVIEGELYDDRFCTRITFNRHLRHVYQRDSVRIYANVVEATHGETQREVLGSGDGAKEFQQFSLKRAEVSQLVVPNERGIQSTLVVKVNDVEWDEQESLREATEQREAFVSQTNDAQQMTVVFGDGVNGSRLPTGLENVRAEYRTGLGRKGNVAGGQINQLLGAPLGVKKVNNPLVAKGGADPESRELARVHAPLAVTAMDRLVSVQDYEDFARTYAGIGKASASIIQGTVHVTIAGLDPEPLDADNPIFSNLMHAFGIFGDPSQSFELHPREASLLIIVAKIKIDRRYEWQHVQPKIRTALLEQFHYDRRDLGQDVLLSDAIATVQSIEGVSYVDVDRFDAVRQQDVGQLATRLGNTQRRPRVHVNLARYTSDSSERATLGISDPSGPGSTTPVAIAATAGQSTVPDNEQKDIPKLRPAELCYLTPDIPDTLILELIP